MTLIVTPDPNYPSRGILTCGAQTYACALGRGGVSQNKVEGDGATPIGTFPLRRLFYRADRLSVLATTLPATAIGQHDGWCDEPADANYNRMVRMPYGASAEHLWRDDHVYDVIVVIGYNDAPTMAGKGSAIFMHLATADYAPTAGCVALSQADLISLLKTLPSDPVLTIRA
jgi:L,D-peptidoglycan transpeptidase YkuD (ErfK/YbiS/YcfS/YnhG family)